MSRFQTTLTLAAGSLLLATLAACGSSDGGGASTAPSTDSGSSAAAATDAASSEAPDSGAAAMVTDEMKSKAFSSVVMNDYPPAGFVEGGEIKGTNPDLLRAIAEETGLDIAIEGSSWDAMIPGLQAGRWDIMHAGAIITPERLAMFDFVSVEQNYSAFVTKAGSPVTIAQDSDVCGLTISVVKASIDAATVEQINKDVCEPGGMELATLQTFAGNDAALLAVSSGRVDALVTAGAVVPAILKESDGQFVEQPLKGGITYGGIALPKGSELGPVFVQAVKDLIASGKYQEIYENYDSGTAIIDNPELMTG